MHGYTTLTTGQPAASGERSDPYRLNDPTDPLCAPASPGCCDTSARRGDPRSPCELRIAFGTTFYGARKRATYRRCQGVSTARES